MSRPSARSLAGARGFAYVVALGVLAGLFALITPVPAAAHVAGTGGSPTNYRTMVTSIRPAVPTVAVTVGLGGQWVRVTGQGAAAIVILGYRGEPFLRLSQNQVQANELSGTVAETGVTGVIPTSEDSAAGPKWVQLRAGDSVTWTDARIDSPLHGDGTQPASGTWELPLVVDGQQVTVLGTKERIPAPSPWPWWAALGLLTAAVAAIGWMRNWHRPMAAVVGAGILFFVLHLLGAGSTPQQNGPVFGWIGVGAVIAFSLLVGGVTVVSALRRRESAPERVVMAGAVVLVLAATDISVLWNSQLPFAGPAVLDRALTVCTYAIAVGLLVAGVHLVRERKSGARLGPGE